MCQEHEELVTASRDTVTTDLVPTGRATIGMIPRAESLT